MNFYWKPWLSGFYHSMTNTAALTMEGHNNLHVCQRQRLFKSCRGFITLSQRKAHFVFARNFTMNWSRFALLTILTCTVITTPNQDKLVYGEYSIWKGRSQRLLALARRVCSSRSTDTVCTQRKKEKSAPVAGYVTQ